MRTLLTSVGVALLFLAGCTTVHDLGGGRFVVPRAVEHRSPFGTNMGYVMLETCEGTPSPYFPWQTDYRNCQGLTEWAHLGSQGQGGQIVSGLLQAGGLLGLGVLMPAPAGTVTPFSTNGTGTANALSTQGAGASSAGKGHY